MRVAAYIRVSTEEQADKGNSLTEQRERLSAYCTAMGWDTPIFYEDDGYSAKDMRRPALTDMLDDVKQKKYDRVITTKLDRFFRKLIDLLNTVDFLDRYECQFISSSEAFDTSTPSGRLCLQLLGSFAEFERERIRERVKDNMMSIARAGNKVITRPCFGYDVIDGVMTVNIEEAIVVRKMAAWALQGEGGRAIAKRLNEAGIRSKEGTEWHDRVIREFLKRETLIGNFVYNKTYKKGTRIITRPESEWIRLENQHEPILEEETHREIIHLFEGRKTVGRHINDDTYLLSGLLVCKHCGNKMNGKLNKSFSKKLNQTNMHYQYLCDGYLKKAICYHHYIPRDGLETLIVKRIKEVANGTPGKLKLVVAKKERPALAKESLEAKLKKLDRKIQKQIEAYEEDLITKEALRNATERVELERKQILDALQVSEEEKSQGEEKAIKARAMKLLGEVLSEDRVKAKNAIRKLIHRIYISDGEKVEIEWSEP